MALEKYKILSLDGGGAKGFYTLGILDEIEKNTKRPICQSFDLIFGTSTGSIIATLLARGDSVASVLELYNTHVPSILKPDRPGDRSKALRKFAEIVLGGTQVSDFKTGVGIVATNWKEERPLIFKASPAQAHGSLGSFVPFFGCSVADAVVGSCSAYPFFDRVSLRKSNGDILEVADGGFCANNPTLYAIADAVKALKMELGNIRVISLGVGSYPEPDFWRKMKKIWGGWGVVQHSFSSEFLQKIMGTNTTSMEVLRNILFKEVKTVRIDEAFPEPAMATDFLEVNREKLNRLTQKGRISYAKSEAEILEFLL